MSTRGRGTRGWLRRAAAAGIGMLVLAACSTSPSSSLPASVPSGLPTPTPGASLIPVDTAPPVAFTIQTIPTEYTTPLLDVSTDGREIVWSRGAADSGADAAPDVWAYTPGEPRPHEVYANPLRDSTIDAPIVHDGRYAFVEANQRAYGEDGFRIWLLSGGKRLLVDQSERSASNIKAPIPFLTMSDDRLVWSTIHQTASGPRFELLSYDIASGSTVVLESADPAKTEFWFPSFDADGQRLVYATVEKAGGSADQFHVYLLDLQTGGPTRRLDAYGNATMPVISGDSVVWKQVNGNVFNAAVLVRIALSNPALQEETVSVLGDGLNYPSAGTRYVAAWQNRDTDLGLLDLQTGERVVVDQTIPDDAGLERPMIAGNLLEYVRGFFDTKPLELCWTWTSPAAAGSTG